MKTSSIFCSPISLKVFISSGSFGHARRGSVISSKLISIISAYLAFLSGLSRTGSFIHSSIFWALLSNVLGSPYPSEISHLSKTIFEFKYSIIGASSSKTVQPEADLSAEASESSKACSIFKSDKPSISRHLPEKTFFLPSFSTVRRPFWIAA